MTAEPVVADVEILDLGTVVLVQVNTDTAALFVAEHVELEDWQWLGARSFAVDFRYAADLVAGMQDHGLTVE